jgi:hypothetical protein
VAPVSGRHPLGVTLLPQLQIIFNLSNQDLLLILVVRVQIPR